MAADPKLPPYHAPDCAGGCDGRGWVEGVDHAPECHTTGECVCEGVPVQTACPSCATQTGGGDDAPF